jgi:chromosome partitioning protein
VRTIAIINQKGGCGKTTTAINLGACLGLLGRRTLLIDLDPQGHCAAGLGVPEREVEIDSADLLQAAGSRHLDTNRMLWRCARNLDLIPSRVRLAGLEAPGSAFGKREGRERSLTQSLGAFGDRFDVCILDCPPSISLLTFNALVAADLVLVPVETGYFSLQGAARQLTTVRAVGRRLGADIRCAVLPTLHEPGLAVAEDLLAELQRRFGKRLLPVTIRRDPSLREAVSFGRPVCDHAPNSVGAHDYAALASILIESESLLAGAPEDDWQDIEAAAERETPRPGPSRRDTGADSLIIPGQDGSVFVTSATMAGPALGQVVVTGASGEFHPGLAHRLREPALHPTPNRAEEIARRTALARPLPAEKPSDDTPCRTTPRPAFGCRVSPSGAEFIQPGALGKRVAVAGKFSHWQPVDLALNQASNTHTLRLSLAPGRHEYRLVVDGHWIADPYNTDWVLNEFGEPHSIVEVPRTAAAIREADLPCGAD